MPAGIWEQDGANFFYTLYWRQLRIYEINIACEKMSIRWKWNVKIHTIISSYTGLILICLVLAQDVREWQIV